MRDPEWNKDRVRELLASYDEQAGPRKPADGSHITREKILWAYHQASRVYHKPEYALDLLCDTHRGVDVYHALRREADAGTIIPMLEDKEMGYIVRYRPAED